MNVAGLEICVDLHWLSRWEDTAFKHGERFTPMIGNRMELLYQKGMAHVDTPAYDAGYLLQKLPVYIIREGVRFHLQLLKYRGEYKAQYRREPDQYAEVVLADTPEDALAKLAIELFKQGILTREGN